MNPIKVLTRLFRRDSANTVISLLYANAINQPLFVHPALGEMIIQGYMDAKIDMAHRGGVLRETMEPGSSIGIIDISGALVARYTPGPSGTGPVSYEEIGAEFSAMMDDPGITAIVLRLDTPGGMAAQNIDLADRIFSARGKGKRIIAMVDDMAYSSGYAIASAADEIWLTRTSGVGSVGVVSYHVDQSKFNDKLGVSIEYLFAGARKVDGHPHGPLGDDARVRFQGEIDRLYDLFIRTVARNRGMTVEAVKATEAGTFHGERAIDAGFADRIGTFDELIEFLTIGDEMPDDMQDEPMRRRVPSMESEDGEHGKSKTDGHEPAPSIEPPESSAPVVDDAAEAAAKISASIRAICTAAGVPDAAAHYIEAGTDIEAVRKELIDMRTAAEIDIRSAIPVRMTKDESAEAQAGWHRAFAKINPR